MDRTDRARGCMVGIGIGDALGAPVEFMGVGAIKEAYGPHGIRNLQPWSGHPAGYITDDTQMSIATAKGILDAYEGKADEVLEYIYARYVQWANSGEANGRAPGVTCMTALADGFPVQGSKGCGGVMRVAPIGLAGYGEQTWAIAAQAGHLTHAHVTSDVSCGYLATLISYLMEGVALSEAAFAVRYDNFMLMDSDTKHVVDWALALALRPSKEAILDISAMATVGSEPNGRGMGWVAEEALGIGLYCALRNSDDFVAGVCDAANITGDSDSTASIAGAILGAHLGEKAIPADWQEQLERVDELRTLGGLLGDCAE